VVPVSGDPEIGEIAAVIDDECTRCILMQAYEQYLSVGELAKRCNVSESTVYRRLDSLRELELIDERTQPESEGHHFTQIQNSINRLTVEISEKEFEIEIQRRRPMAKRLTEIVERL
jgi:DNA-binding transcriptional ArsR family regulator